MNVIKFLENHNIPHSTEGKNVAYNHVGIKCPFPNCVDKSNHMGINLLNGRFSCWLDETHSGRSFTKLAHLLVGGSYTEVTKMVESSDKTFITNTNSVDQIKQIFTNVEKHKIEVPKTLNLPNTFMKIERIGATSRFFKYFKRRGFEGNDQLERFIRQNKILCCLSGEWKDRIIFPVYFSKELVTWTSRSIFDDAYLKHKDLSLEKSVIHIKNCLYGYDDLLDNGIALFLVEGIFDALKLNYYFPRGHKATCLATKTIRISQLKLLKEISRHYQKVVILLDNDASAQTMEAERKLSMINNVSFEFLPKGIKDPGEMDEKQILELVE